MPKLKGAVFESAVTERYRRREESVEEALIDMYLAGVSTRQVDDISQLLWGGRMPSQTLSDKLKKVYGEIEAWRTRPLEDEYPYVFMDGVWRKRSWGGSVENVSVLVAIGVNAEGHREVIGVAEGMKEDRDSWEQFVRSMCVSASWRPQYGHYFSAAQAAGFQQEPHRRNPPPLFPWLSGHEGVLAAV